ncbi:recombination protein RecR [Candidatus Gracilibacteria bacterium]|nr:recombination protein RecR [Candidatus Gracilibacteria bacterium]
MFSLPSQIQNAIQALAKLPGIGPKSASRLVYHLIKKTDQEVQQLGQAIMQLKVSLRFCRQCFQITDHELCSICADDKRNQYQIMVVEEPLDVIAFERIKYYQGVYHVLHGILKPMEGVGPDHLKITELVTRIQELTQKNTNNAPIEIVLAVSPSLEGESTSAYIAQLITQDNVKVSRIGVGIPIGSSVEYADEITLGQAFQGRRQL